MNNLETLQAKINIHTTILKFRNSIEDLQKNNPHRNDLIQSMTESLEDLIIFERVFNELADELRIEAKANFRNEIHIAELKYKIKELQIELKIKDEL